MSVRLNTLPDSPRRKETMLTRVSPLSHLPEGVTLQIFSYLNPLELGRCHLVSREWRVLASTDALWKALTPAMAFGKKKWETYFGEVGEEPPLPRNIHQILRSPCPFWKGKRVEETHLLVLIPKSVSNQPLTLKHLEELVKSLKGKWHTTRYRFFWDSAIELYEAQPVEKSYWMLMTRDILPDSRGDRFDQHQARLQKYPSYEMPSVLEVSIALFTEYAVSQVRLYSDNPWTYTRCQEKIGNHFLAVGGFALGGLAICHDRYDRIGGMGCCRKL